VDRSGVAPGLGIRGHHRPRRARHGADELNFDYVRFPSDGDLNEMYFPNWDGKTPKHEVIRKFFGYLRKQLAGAGCPAICSAWPRSTTTTWASAR